MKKYVFLLLLLLALDQWSKWFFQERTFTFWIFSLHPITNTGALFGMFQGWNLLFIFLSFLVLVFVFLLLRKEPLVCSLLTVGIVGNLVDRILLGHVRDFIDIGFWPVFNIADASLTIGVFVLLFSALRHTSTQKQ